MEQMFINLMKNSVEAMPGGGTIQFLLGKKSFQNTPGRRFPAGEYLTLIMEDSGVGFDPALLRKIFQPGTTTKTFGSGLGLYSVQHTLREHGSYVFMENRSCGGARFIFFFPLDSRDDESRETCREVCLFENPFLETEYTDVTAPSEASALFLQDPANAPVSNPSSGDR